ncbi:MAG: peptide chain release factor N(5)-glutamine methyltransferase [Clostridia bacterium]|nr:peptide chain release factor N(5)-glutamine methyltransferase [Clostridia bacterium]
MKQSIRGSDETTPSFKTVRMLFEEGAQMLDQAGIEDARSVAEFLLCHLLKKDRVYLYAYGATIVDETVSDLFFSLIQERLSGKPLQYIIGTAEFMGITLEVTPSVLIPRQDTELLAETALFEISQRPSECLEVLDLCTGSGALAIALAKLADHINVTASDLSKDALLLAKKNAASANLCRPICFFEGDLFEALPPECLFDLIVSNPPYIASAVVDTLEVHVREHEPRHALDGGEDGMDFVRKILTQAPFHLKRKGMLLMEIGYDQGARALALAAEAHPYDPLRPPFAKARILKDLSGNDRVLIASLE